ncbi:mannitol dehydrogenase family protein [Tateyamaria sp. SN3-11]|uniref:mannitol dehydrogenase family protein n=1 Tax=Tateyamaria sp. SN3-11 TaxID=3092147 RepID=UPI0039EBD8B9
MPRILHLGVGNFFRAHLADYTQSCPDWRITGVSFRSPTVRDGLKGNGYAYALVIKDAHGTEIKQITALDEMLVLSEDPQAILTAMRDPEVAVISLTVTEKAYHLNGAGHLDLAAPAIVADLSGGALTPVGALARGLVARTTPVTVLCCDNLPENGRKLEAAVAAFAHAAGLSLLADVTYPATMVDRITPATTDDIRAEAGDDMAVPTEAFSEWVVEDRFAAARPDWPGVQWVDDVAPHEMRKLRMLNGAHSYLAYAGTLRGHTFVHEAVGDPVLRAGAQQLMEEAAATLPPSVQAQAADYTKALLDRFDNPNLHHRLRQIAMDGSQKMPIRIVATLKDRAGAHSPALHNAVAAWCAFVQADVAAGRALDDPMADQIATACQSGDPDAALRTLIGA